VLEASAVVLGVVLYGTALQAVSSRGNQDIYVLVLYYLCSAAAPQSPGLIAATMAPSLSDRCHQACC
jgi:hypothetical protein